jgi:hypothetical protein
MIAPPFGVARLGCRREFGRELARANCIPCNRRAFHFLIKSHGQFIATDLERIIALLNSFLLPRSNLGS